MKLSENQTGQATQAIREDLSNLKHDVVDLGHHAKEEAKRRIEDAAAGLQDKAAEVKAVSQREVEEIKSYVQGNPIQSVGLAFLAGIAIAFLTGRR